MPLAPDNLIQIHDYLHPNDRFTAKPDDAGQSVAKLIGDAKYSPPGPSPAAVRLLRAIEMGDFDIAFPGCGKALRELIEGSYVTTNEGHKRPVFLTPKGAMVLSRRSHRA